MQCYTFYLCQLSGVNSHTRNWKISAFNSFNIRPDICKISNNIFIEYRIADRTKRNNLVS